MIYNYISISNYAESWVSEVISVVFNNNKL